MTATTWLELEPSPRPSPAQLVVFGLFFVRESMTDLFSAEFCEHVSRVVFVT